MENVSNPNDFKVVQFHNSTDFDFTPELGCMYDSRPIFGISGAPCIKAGETITLPYHVGNQLATNLAKALMTKNAPVTDVAGIPTGVPLWNTTQLEEKKQSFLKELYSEVRPVAQTETDKLMAKVEEYKKLVEDALGQRSATGEANTASDPATTGDATVIAPAGTTDAPITFQDKADVLAELEKRNIPHDKRKNKVELEKLLQPVA